jgi:response regulator RpfG family c-di-GMP phosphodiesterase
VSGRCCGLRPSGYDEAAAKQALETVSGTLVWALIGVGAWLILCAVAVRTLAFGARSDAVVAEEREHAEPSVSELLVDPARRRILLVDDDPALRLLLRTTLGLDEFAIEEASSAEEAAQVARFWLPTVVILDVGLPGMDGFRFCRELKENARYGRPFVLLLTGHEATRTEIERAGPDAVLRKPFSPIELVGVLDRMGEPGMVAIAEPAADDAEQLLVYARDLSALLAIERSQRRLLQQSYRQTVIALADALEAKDPVTGLHAVRVQRYATELVGGVDPRLLEDPSMEYGFLLHDVGKLAIPDAVLKKEAPLSWPERQVMQQHTLLGEAMLANVTLMDGAGLKVVRSHHERWDGTGYPDGLVGDQIPIAARIFALVDAMDAMTTDRPYRPAQSWESATDEILAQAGKQFDPRCVAAFAQREGRMRRISEELAEAAA